MELIRWRENTLIKTFSSTLAVSWGEQWTQRKVTQAPSQQLKLFRLEESSVKFFFSFRADNVEVHMPLLERQLVF